MFERLPDGPLPSDYFAVNAPRDAALQAYSLVNTHRRPTWKTLISDTHRLTGKPVRRQRLSKLAGSGVTGMWFEVSDYHLVVHPPLSAYHLHYVLGHECAHMVFSALGWAPTPPHSQVDPRSLSVDELITSASAHRMDLRAPGETAAELFAILATETERKARHHPFRQGLG